MSPLAAVIADTHMPRRARTLPGGLIPHLKRADLILHAGDLVDPALLEELAAYAPTRAVRGNLDPPEAGLPETMEFEFGGVKVAMIHDSGSHIPWLEDEDALLLLNPGSPTDKRRQPDHTFALLRVAGDEVAAEVLAL
jgi:predicted phosphodiesterase